MRLELKRREIPDHLLKYFRPIRHKPKDLINIPGMFAERMREDGWYLRGMIPWIKRNGMPSSVTDRPTISTETICLFAKTSRPFYDLEAVRIPFADARQGRNGVRKAQAECYAVHGEVDPSANGGRSRRDVDWWFDSLRHLLAEGGPVVLNGELHALDICPTGYDGEHYAAWPPALVVPMVRASTPEVGVCGGCGAPWRRVTEKEPDGRTPYKTRGVGPKGEALGKTNGVQKVLREDGRGGDLATKQVRSVGWSPSCKCGLPQSANVPSLVLDPFAGSGTTLQVATGLGRRALGIDLNESSRAMAQGRCGWLLDTPAPVESEPVTQGSLDL